MGLCLVQGGAPPTQEFDMEDGDDDDDDANDENEELGSSLQHAGTGPSKLAV